MGRYEFMIVIAACGWILFLFTTYRMLEAEKYAKLNLQGWQRVLNHADQMLEFWVEDTRYLHWLEMELEARGAEPPEGAWRYMVVSDEELGKVIRGCAGGTK